VTGERHRIPRYVSRELEDYILETYLHAEAWRLDALGPWYKGHLWVWLRLEMHYEDALWVRSHRSYGAGPAPAWEAASARLQRELADTSPIAPTTVMSSQR
jgi:hypothetical protein